MVQRAERVLVQAQETHRRAVQRAAEKRAERTELAIAMAQHVHTLGEAEDTVSPPARPIPMIDEVRRSLNEELPANGKTVEAVTL